ncbi:hypothetical protein ACJX0J_034922, partial [Zea mays]
FSSSVHVLLCLLWLLVRVQGIGNTKPYLGLSLFFSLGPPWVCGVFASFYLYQSSLSITFYVFLTNERNFVCV